MQSSDPTPGDLNWDDLRIIAALGTGGSLAEAARRLKVNHSTVYRRLGALENRLKTRLFERFRDGYQPTAAGLEALELAQSMARDIQDLTARLAGRDMALEGTVRLTMSDTLVGHLMPLIAKFRDAYPGIVLELVVSNEFVNLTRRDCDIALRPANNPPDVLVGRRLGVIKSAVYGSADEGIPKAEDLTNQSWIGFDDTLAHLAAAQWLDSHVEPARIRVTASSFLALRSLAEAGQGLCVLPCFIAMDGGLTRLSSPIADLDTDLWLLTHDAIRNTARIRAFLDFTAENKTLLEDLFTDGTSA
jgi:DNA-binding transcriptional LysR family regulator